jgi:hypothetical protein
MCIFIIIIIIQAFHPQINKMVLTRAQSKTTSEDMPAAAAKPKRTRAASATSSAKGRNASKDETKTKAADTKPLRKKVQIAEPVKSARSTKLDSKTADELPKTTAKSQPKTKASKDRKTTPNEEPKSIMRKTKSQTAIKVEEQTASKDARSTRAMRPKRNPAIASKVEPKAAPAMRARRAAVDSKSAKPGPSISTTTDPSLPASVDAPVLHTISLSPAKPLGSPIRLPPRPNTLQESPVRCSPLRLGAGSAHKSHQLPPPAFGTAAGASTASIRASPLRAGSGSVHKPRPTPIRPPIFALTTDAGAGGANPFRTSALSPFKSLGTPIRRPLGASGLFGGGGPMTAMQPRPSKRLLDESPRRPTSAYADKRARVGGGEQPATPVRRPRSAEEARAGLGSCLRGGRGEGGVRKTVAFVEGPVADVEEEEASFGAEPMVLDRRSLSTVVEVSTQSGSPAPAVAEAGVEVQPVLLLDEPAKAPAVLAGTTFYLDVWGSDGSCANQYFEPLLEELGARVVKEWGEDVTHVLYKDGDGKSLQRAERSGVRCVNVGWAVE